MYTSEFAIQICKHTHWQRRTLHKQRLHLLANKICIHRLIENSINIGMRNPSSKAELCNNVSAPMNESNAQIKAVAAIALCAKYHAA
jgi:hypothetical protein